MSRVLTHEQARTVYDRLGAGLDLERFFENAATRRLLEHGAFGEARAVVEFGTGTGRLAHELLRSHLPAQATYAGFDVSPRMVELTRATLAPFGERSRVERTDGSPALPLPDESCDRFVSAYVADLLSDEDIRALLAEARRVLAPGGRLCLTSMTFGEGPVSRGLCGLWSRLHDWRPGLVGGCRPLRLGEYVAQGWRVMHREVVCVAGFCSEVVIATPA